MRTLLEAFLIGLLLIVAGPAFAQGTPHVVEKNGVKVTMQCQSMYGLAGVMVIAESTSPSVRLASASFQSGTVSGSVPAFADGTLFMGRQINGGSKVKMAGMSSIAPKAGATTTATVRYFDPTKLQLVKGSVVYPPSVSTSVTATDVCP